MSDIMLDVILNIPSDSCVRQGWIFHRIPKDFLLEKFPKFYGSEKKKPFQLGKNFQIGKNFRPGRRLLVGQILPSWETHPALRISCNFLGRIICIKKDTSGKVCWVFVKYWPLVWEAPGLCCNWNEVNEEMQLIIRTLGITLCPEQATGKAKSDQY